MRMNRVFFLFLVLTIISSGCRKKPAPTTTPLHWAAKTGDVQQLDSLLSSGADANVGSDSYIGCPLFLAIHKNQERMVKILLDGGANPNTTSFGGQTPLHIAVQNINTSIMELLIAENANVNAHDNSGSTPLHEISYYTSDHKNKDAANLLIAHGADLEAKDHKGVTPLHIAAYVGDRYVVELLVTKGANVNSKNNDGEIPLAYVLSHHSEIPLPHYSVIEPTVIIYLIKHGADINLSSDNKTRLLSFAASEGIKDLSERLIVSGAEVNPKDRRGNRTHGPLLKAICSGHDEIAKFLIANVADMSNLNIRDDSGNMPLHEAILMRNMLLVERPLTYGSEVDALDSSGNPPHEATLMRNELLIERLLTYGAEVDAFDASGNPPLHHAARENDTNLIKLLLAHGADVDLKNRSGISPLHYAVAAGYNNIIMLLLKSGADANIRDNDGDTPLHSAALKNHKEIVELLLANGAEVTAKDNSGRTPVDEAARRGHSDIVELLRK